MEIKKKLYRCNYTERTLESAFSCLDYIIIVRLNHRINTHSKCNRNYKLTTSIGVTVKVKEQSILQLNSLFF